MMEWDREDSSLTPVLPVLRALLACATSSRMLSARDTSTCARYEQLHGFKSSRAGSKSMAQNKGKGCSPVVLKLVRTLLRGTSFRFPQCTAKNSQLWCPIPYFTFSDMLGCHAWCCEGAYLFQPDNADAALAILAHDQPLAAVEEVEQLAAVNLKAGHPQRQVRMLRIAKIGEDVRCGTQRQRLHCVCFAAACLAVREACCLHLAYM